MRQPLWIINSALLALFFVCCYAVFLLQPKIPKAASLIPDHPIANQDTQQPQINLKTIYDHDLFKTHIYNNQQEESITPSLDLPLPPAYQEMASNSNNLPTFLEPLPITITGIMTFGNEAQNRAIIRDNRNQVERTYQVGNDLEDAQIVRILSNKVIIIRSNSQQETLFLREQDAILDLDLIEPDWNELIKKNSEYSYQIKTKEFVAQIKNLGKLVDMLNIITAYKAGISTGIKIGSNTVSALVNYLGLQSGDIILSINDIALDQTTGRLAAYQLAIDPKTTVLNLKIVRNLQEINLEYLLLASDQTPMEDLDNSTIVQQYIESNQSKFTALNDKIKDKDRTNIAQFKNKISQSVSG